MKLINKNKYLLINLSSLLILLLIRYYIRDIYFIIPLTTKSYINTYRKSYKRLKILILPLLIINLI